MAKNSGFRGFFFFFSFKKKVSIKSLSQYLIGKVLIPLDVSDTLLSALHFSHGVLHPNVKEPHGAVLRPRHEDVPFDRMKVDLVDHSRMFVENVELPLLGRLAHEVPNDDGSVGGGRGQHRRLQMAPDDVVAGKVEVDALVAPHVDVLVEAGAAATAIAAAGCLVVTDGEDLEDGTTADSNHVVLLVAIQVEDAGRTVQLEAHGPPKQLRLLLMGLHHDEFLFAFYLTLNFLRSEINSAH